MRPRFYKMTKLKVKTLKRQKVYGNKIKEQQSDLPHPQTLLFIFSSNGYIFIPTSNTFWM